MSEPENSEADDRNLSAPENERTSDEEDGLGDRTLSKGNLAETREIGNEAGIEVEDEDGKRKKERRDKKRMEKRRKEIDRYSSLEESDSGATSDDTKRKKKERRKSKHKKSRHKRQDEEETEKVQRLVREAGVVRRGGEREAHLLRGGRAQQMLRTAGGEREFVVDVRGNKDNLAFGSLYR